MWWPLGVSSLGSALALVLLLGAAPAEAQGPEALAQRRFEEGLAAREEGRHEEALEAFRASNELFGSPNSRLMIARSLRDLGRLAEAWGEYRLAAAQARDRVTTEPRYAATLESATEEGEALVGEIGRLRVTLEPSPEGATLEVQGRTYPAAALGTDVAVDPGEVTVLARAPGHLDAEASITIAGGGEQRVSLALETAPVVEPPEPPGGSEPSRPPWDVLGLTFGGAAVVGAVLWPVFFALADARYGEAEQLCGMGSCPPSAEPIIDEGQRFEIATNVSWIGALGFAALSVTFLLLAWL